MSILQRQDGSELVDIYYDYFSSSTISPANVSAFVSTNGTDYASIPIPSIIGDYGCGVMTGRNRIIWKTNTISSKSTSVYIKLSVFDSDGNPNLGVNTAIGILDLNPPSVNIRRLSIEEEYPIGVTSYSQIILLNESAETEYFYLINGILSTTNNFISEVNTDYRVNIPDEYGGDNYYYIVNGRISITKDYLNPISLNYSVGILDDGLSTYYYYIRNGVITTK